MSQTESPLNTGVGPYRKPRADLYTVLLILALLAIIVTTVVLYFETSDYPSPPFKGTTPPPPVSMNAEPAGPMCALADSALGLRCSASVSLG